MNILNKTLAAGALFLSVVSGSYALDASPQAGFASRIDKKNVAGGFSYLPDGDIIAFTDGFLTGPLSLIRYDVNGDGLPQNGSQTIAQFEGAFPSFVQVSPSGTFALAGITFPSKIVRIDFPSNTVTDFLADAPGNYDLTFVNDSEAYLSANPGGFDPAQPNVISHVAIGATATLTPVAEFLGTPSGPIAVDGNGDLFYIKGTFDFPAPPQSFHLMRLTAGNLEAARNSGNPLNEANSPLDIPMDGGFDIATHQLSNGSFEIFISTTGAKIFRYTDADGLQDFATAGDPSGAPGLTGLAFFNPLGTFESNTIGNGKLGIAAATEFFSKFSLVEILPYASTPRPFSTSLAPQIGNVGVTATNTASNGVQLSSLSVSLEKLVSRAQYEVTLRQLGKNGKTRTTTTKKANVSFRKLRPGTYVLSYRIVKKVNGRNRKSRRSARQVVVIG